MYYMGTYCKDKEDFINKIETMIAGWEKMCEVDGRRAEYENVI